MVGPANEHEPEHARARLMNDLRRKVALPLAVLALTAGVAEARSFDSNLQEASDAPALAAEPSNSLLEAEGAAPDSFVAQDSRSIHLSARSIKPAVFGLSGNLNSSFSGLSSLAQNGVSLIRFDAGWGSAEPSPPTQGEPPIYNWGPDDNTVAMLAKAHLRGWPIIDYNAEAEWTAADNDPFTPPNNPADFVAFAKAFVARYGPNGLFWQANPQLPKLPINEVEIWNEENNSQFMHYAIAPGVTYAVAPGLYFKQLYEPARQAIHEEAPGVKVDIGGLLTSATVSGLKWLSTLEKEVPGALKKTDAVDLHPYDGNPQDNLATVQQLRANMDKHGGSNDEINITEYDNFQFGPAKYSLDLDEQTIKQMVDLDYSNCKIGAIIGFELQGTNSTGSVDGSVDGYYDYFNSYGNPTPVGRYLFKLIQNEEKLISRHKPALLCTN